MHGPADRAERLARVADHDRSQEDRDHLPLRHLPVLHHRRRGGADHAPPAGAAGRHAGDARDLQRPRDDARHHDDLPVRGAGARGLRQLLRAAHDRRARHGLPAPERALVLAAGLRRHRLLHERLLRAADRPAGPSTRRSSDDSYLPSGGVDAWIFLIHLTGISSLLGAINFVATIHNMRARGMGWGRMPLFIWTILVYSYLLIARPAGGGHRGHDAAHRPPLRHRLLRPHRWRRPDALAAPVLVLRPPRGLHHDPARPSA